MVVVSLLVAQQVSGLCILYLTTGAADGNASQYDVTMHFSAEYWIHPQLSLFSVFIQMKRILTKMFVFCRVLLFSEGTRFLLMHIYDTIWIIFLWKLEWCCNIAVLSVFNKGGTNPKLCRHCNILTSNILLWKIICNNNYLRLMSREPLLDILIKYFNFTFTAETNLSASLKIFSSTFIFTTKWWFIILIHVYLKRGYNIYHRQCQ